MNKIFSWIHLSDIHMRSNNDNTDSKLMREKLPGYIESLGGSPNVIIFSGDYRYAPDGEKDPQKIAEYIRKCANSAKISDASRIILVPGNHDINRGKVRSLITNNIVESYKPDEGTIINDLMAQLKNDYQFYNDLRKELKVEEIVFAENPHVVKTIDGVNLLLLNTTITANGGAEDYNKLVVSSALLLSSMKGIGSDKPIIAVGHHGLDWWKTEEKKYIEKYFDNEGITLYLCGHSHESWVDSFGENGGKQVNVGCLVGANNDVDVSFAVGSFYDTGRVDVEYHKWDKKQQNWVYDNVNTRENLLTYPNKVIENNTVSSDYSNDQRKDYPFSLYAYHLLGSLGEDGIKYIWKKHDEKVESVTLNKRLKISEDVEDNKTSAYYISTSIGCQLNAINKSCIFCGTGHREFAGELSSEEIALQCIFMAEYDSNCASFPQVRENSREFAFIGQGEPAYNYAAIREAILLTDIAMSMINQKVSRYVISTFGVPDLIMALIEDIKNKTYNTPIDINFSLGIGGEERNEIMPFNKDSDYHEFIEACKYYYKITGAKIAVSILLFDNFNLGNGKKLTLSSEKLTSTLRALDPNVFRIDLCTVNKTTTGHGNGHTMSNEQANNLLDTVHELGFEGKIFTSYGESQKSGCGMLDSGDDEIEMVGDTSKTHFIQAIELLKKAKEKRLESIINSNLQMFEKA